MNSHFQKDNKHQRVPQIHYSPEMYVEITVKYHFTYISLTEWEGWSYRHPHAWLWEYRLVIDIVEGVLSQEMIKLSMSMSQDPGIFFLGISLKNSCLGPQWNMYIDVHHSITCGSWRHMFVYHHNRGHSILFGPFYGIQPEAVH